MAPCRRDHRRADVNRSEPEPEARQAPCQLPGAASNLEHGAACMQPSRIYNELDELGGVAKPTGMVQVRDAIEKRPAVMPERALLVSLSTRGHTSTLASEL